MTVPNVSYKVEVAWTSNWLTPAASRVWTDISSYVELSDSETMKIDHGRSDEVDTADANTLTLTLDNKDARFTWGNAASPYYPNVKIGKPIRVTATVGGVDYVRFTGLVDEWPVEWPGESAGFATATLTASSRMSRLGLGSPLVNALERTLLTDFPPDLYWPLTETAGPGAEVQGRAPALYGNSKITFGTGVDDGADKFACDGRPVVKALTGDSGDSWGSAHLGAEFTPAIPFSGNITFGLFVQNLSPVPYVSGNFGFFGFWPPDESGALGMAYDRPEYSVHPSALPGVHFLAFTREQTSPTTFTLTNYLDGQVIRTTSGSASAYTSLIRASVSLADDSEVRQFGRFAMWDRVLSTAELTQIADAGRGLFAGDATDERITRVAGWSGIDAAEVDTSPSPVTLAGMPAEGAKALTLMREAETAEAGVLYDSRDGLLTLRLRSDRYELNPTLTVALTSDRLAGYAPKVDRQGLANVGTGRGPAGDELAYEDAESREEYGDHDYTVDTTAENPDEPLQLVAWRINNNAEPKPRVPAPSLSVVDFIGTADLALLLSLDVGHKLRLTNAPTQAPNAASADYFVEGYTEEMSPGAWSINPNLTPVALEDDVLILDSVTEGVLDTGVLAL